MKIVTIVGARPQFIKAAPVCKALRKAGHNEFLVHTGQHYDDNMSAVFFQDLDIPEPDVNLGVGSGTQGWQTGLMLTRIEKVLMAEKPDWVLVYGDTNSTLAGALTAVKLHIPVAHVEAGLRSFNREMPEEHNRVLTDHCSDLLFCPTQTAVDNLSREGIGTQSKNRSFSTDVNYESPIPAPWNAQPIPLGSNNKQPKVALVGDTMYDAVLQFAEIARKRSTILEGLELKPKKYLLATVHRPYNVDDHKNLHNILSAFHEIGEPIVFPVHPRTRQKIVKFGLDKLQSANRNVQFIEPVSYLDMLMLEEKARMILTDSGGMQKEAYFFGVPCLTLRPETEWVETVDAGWNIVVGANREKIVKAIRLFELPDERPDMYGDGRAGERIMEFLPK